MHKVKLKVAQNEKKTMWVFFFYKYDKFWSVLRDKKVDLKPLFSEECLTNQTEIQANSCIAGEPDVKNLSYL